MNTAAREEIELHEACGGPSLGEVRGREGGTKGISGQANRDSNGRCSFLSFFLLPSSHVSVVKIQPDA